MTCNYRGCENPATVRIQHRSGSICEVCAGCWGRIEGNMHWLHRNAEDRGVRHAALHAWTTFTVIP